MYNPENVEGKRPKAGEIWNDPDIKQPIEVLARMTTSTLMALGRRKKLSECEDLASLVAWTTPDGKMTGIIHESEFVEAYIYMGTRKSLIEGRGV